MKIFQHFQVDPLLWNMEIPDLPIDMHPLLHGVDMAIEIERAEMTEEAGLVDAIEAEIALVEVVGTGMVDLSAREVPLVHCPRSPPILHSLGIYHTI